MWQRISGRRILSGLTVNIKGGRVVVVYTGIAVIIIILYFCTLPYKRNLRKELDKREYPLKSLFGLAMFITDRFPKKRTKKNTFLNQAIRDLKIRKDIKKERYLYTVNKISYCLIGTVITVLIGIGVEISAMENNSEIKSLKRDNNLEVSYNIYSQNEKGEKKELTIDVGQKQLKKEDILKEMKSKQEELVQKVLGKNESMEYVTEPLNLVSSIGKNNILVSWDIGDNSIIGYDGALSDDIPIEGKLVMLTALMTYQELTLEYSFYIHVFPKKSDGSIESQVQSYIDDEDVYSQEVRLPEKINGEKIIYYNSKRQNSVWIIVVGFVISVAIFVLKDHDMKKELKERNRQLLIDYPEIVSKLLLYHSAGLSIKTAIEKIVDGYKQDKAENSKMFRYAYEELEVAFIKMKSGISVTAAINDYGKNCGLHCYIKLSGIIEQNMRRGTGAMTMVLKNELNAAMLEKKHTMLKEGGQISTKLMGPMIIMLIIAMVIIMVPAFMSMNL